MFRLLPLECYLISEQGVSYRAEKKALPLKLCKGFFDDQKKVLSSLYRLYSSYRLEPLYKISGDSQIPMILRIIGTARSRRRR